jgi:hypothetical protein
VRQQQRARANPRCGQRRLGAGVTAANNDHIVLGLLGVHRYSNRPGRGAARSGGAHSSRPAAKWHGMCLALSSSHSRRHAAQALYGWAQGPTSVRGRKLQEERILRKEGWRPAVLGTGGIQEDRMPGASKRFALPQGSRPSVRQRACARDSKHAYRITTGRVRKL